MEIWKDIKSYEGLYQASNLGNIKSLSRYRNNGSGGYITKDKLLKYGINNKGYLYVNLWKNSTQKKHTVHRLVAQLFIENTEGKSQVNHINGIRNDDRLENLEWATPSENQAHSYKHLERKTTKGLYGHQTKSKKIGQYTIQGKLVYIFHSGTEVERITGYGNQNIFKVCRGQRKTAYGFMWKYI